MRPDDGSFGSELESGTWTGIIGDLVNVSADLSSAGLVVTEKRKKVIDFSLTVVEDKFQLYRLSSQKQASHLNVLAFLKIFNVKVWAAALFTTLLIATVAFLSERQIVNENNVVAFSPYLLGVWFPTDGSTNTTDVQGHTKKVLFLCAGLMTYFLVTSYSVDLIAHMTAGSSMDIRDCLDLKKSNAKLFSDKGTVVSDLLQDGLLKNCKQFSTLLDSSCDLGCKVQIFEKEGSSSMAVYYAPELFDSRLSNIPGFPSPAAPVAFAFPKNSELTALFDHHLLKLIQNGVINRVYYHWIASYRERYSSGSSSSATSEVTALSMDQLFFPMLIIGSGMALAVVVSVLEKLYSTTTYFTKSLVEHRCRGQKKVPNSRFYSEKAKPLLILFSLLNTRTIILCHFVPEAQLLRPTWESGFQLMNQPTVLMSRVIPKKVLSSPNTFL